MSRYFKKIAILTSGGDAPGMNSAIRAVTRSAIRKDLEVIAVREGYKGLISGSEAFQPLDWSSVGGIQHKGGTVIGTARSDEFRTSDGRKEAVFNLVQFGINALIVIGGDGSLIGASILKEEWQEHIKSLIEVGRLGSESLREFPHLYLVGLVGSIDNDIYGTDMTIGADTALHRITEAIDAISSTASSHQRSFVVKVMGRNCGYLALMGALATGSDWVFIPENPPDMDNWEEYMIDRLKAGRKAGRRDTIVVLAEGARDKQGNYIGSTQVSRILEKAFGEEVRVTVLGHVQRGGSPSAFDRNLGSLFGVSAVDTLLDMAENADPEMIVIRGNRISRIPLKDAVNKTIETNLAVQTGDYRSAYEMRGNSFNEAFQTLRTMLRALPHPLIPGKKPMNLAVMHSGAPAPGMNPALRASVRIALDRGHRVLGVRNGFKGFIEGDISPLDWMSVQGFATMGGSELGTNRYVPNSSDFYAIARSIENHNIEGLLIIGGWTGYESAFNIINERSSFPAFQIPIICTPASINNNLPGSELSIGADTALNSIVEAVDKIKHSAVALERTFIVEVMGHYCGYLALMSGLATGAERVYLHEEGISLDDLWKDVKDLMKGFQSGKRLGLIIRNEYANKTYTTNFITALFEEEGGDLFDVRQSILGHLQQGGDPSPFDRIQATRLASRSIQYLIDKVEIGSDESAFIGLQGKEIKFHDCMDFVRMSDISYQRPKDQWWMKLREIEKILR